MERQAKQVHGRAQDGTEGSAEVGEKLSKKVFFRASLDTGRTYVSGRALEAVVPKYFVASLKKRCGRLAPREQELLDLLFFVGRNDNYTVVLPADDHPGKPLRTWRCFYELEMDAAETYVSRFFGDTSFYPVRNFPRVRRDDDVVVIGSQVSNSSTRAILGKAPLKDPLFRIGRDGWRTELHWNLVTPESTPLTTIRDFEGRRGSAAHAFCERGNPVPYQSRRDATQARYLDDYLLVTVLPRRKRERQRILVFSGLHGTGNRAVDLILREPPTDLLENAVQQIAGASYYQILIRVETVFNERGESLPCHPQLVGARPLVVG